MSNSLSSKLSVIIPARDEEQFLPTCLASIHAAAERARQLVEIVVVLNRCQDRTEEIAKESGCVIVHCDAKNLAAIRNTGVKAASGEVIVTIDADSRMSANMLAVVCEELNSGRSIGGGVFIYPERTSLGILITALMLLPWVLWHRIFCGLFFFRREEFDAIGGFNEEMASVEDIDFAVRLKRYGKTKGKKYSLLFRAYITTSCRKFDHFGDWYFVFRPWIFFSLLRGKNQGNADKVWYDFPR